MPRDQARVVAASLAGPLLLGVPCVVGMPVGGLHLLHRRSRQLLILSALAAALPIVTACLAGQQKVGGRLHRGP